MKNKAVFLDKDGTLIPDIPYNIDPNLISLADNAIQGLKLLTQAGYQIIIVSNQSGVARGYFEEQALVAVKQKLDFLLAESQIYLSGFYYCPHHPEGRIPGYILNCDCRKPAPGLIVRAAREMNINLEQSWMIGDIVNDVEAGNRAGCKTVLIKNGNETEWKKGEYRTPDYCAADLFDAAQFILKGN